MGDSLLPPDVDGVERRLALEHERNQPDAAASAQRTLESSP